MENFGVDIIDIGAESTQPGAKSISIEEEIRRIEIYLKELKFMNLNSLISIDTRNQETMKKSLKYGISILNDVSAFSDKKSQNLLSKNDICGVIMHMQNDPKNMQKHPKYFFPPTDIYDFFEKKNKLSF